MIDEHRGAAQGRRVSDYVVNVTPSQERHSEAGIPYTVARNPGNRRTDGEHEQLDSSWRSTVAQQLRLRLGIDTLC